MRAYMCSFMIAVAIIVAAVINKPEHQSCQWNESRIQLIETATLENAAASFNNSRRLGAIESCIVEWNDLFRSLYSN